MDLNQFVLSTFEILDSYCHQEPLLVKHYIIEGDMPAIVLGLFPALLSFITGNVFLFWNIFHNGRLW
jgi:hypothetical protein